METEENITDRLVKFTNPTNAENTYRIPSRFLCDIGKVNHPIKFDIKIICSFETDMAKLSESNQQLVNIGAPHAQK